MAAFSFRPREPSVEGAPGPSQAETGWRAGIGLGLGSLIDRVKSTVLPAAGDQAADEATQQSRIARLLRGPLPPVKTKAEKEDGAKVESGAVHGNGRDPPPPKSSFKSYRRARKAGRSLAAAGDDDATREKTYAPTTCFGTLSRTNPLRALCVRVSESSRFDTFILLTILANAVVLCMMEPTKLEGRGCASPNAAMRGAGNAAIENSELAFTAAFTAEMLIKMIASGVYFEKGAYLRDGWNVMDFVVVVVSLVSLAPGAGSNASALRVVRVLRPLRTLSVLPGMRTLIGTVIRAIPMIGNVILLCVFFFTVFGILGLQLFMGAFRNKCFTAAGAAGCAAHAANDDVVACVDAATVFPDDPTIGSYVLLARDSEQYCARWEAAHWPGYACPDGQRCLKHRNPHGGLIHFDDIAHAWLTIFQCITLEGWTPIMYAAMDAVTGWSVLYFVLLVFTGGFFLLNLALAVITEVYDEESAEARMAADDAEEAAERTELSGAEKEAAERAAKRAALVEYLNGANGGKASGDSDSDEGEEDAGRSDASRVPPKSSASEDAAPAKTKRISLKTFIWTARLDSVKSVVEHRFFGVFFTMCILLNTLVLAMEYDGMSSAYSSGLSAVNVALTVAFAAELAVKLLGLGIEEYFRDAFNTFDALVVVISLVELLLADSGSLSALRAFRILRILKLIRSWHTLQRFLYTMYATVASLGEFAFVVVLAVFIFALLGMQMFGGKMCAESDAHGEPEIPRHNFDTLLWALVTVFQVLTGEDWNAVMYDAALASGPWSSLYFVALLVIGNFLVLNLFIAILLTNFSAQEVSDEAQDARRLLESVSFFNAYVAKERGVETSPAALAERRRREAFFSALPEKPMRAPVAKRWAAFAEKVYDMVLAAEETQRREEAALLEREEAERVARLENARAAREKAEGVGFLAGFALYVASFATPRPGAAPKPLRRYVGNAFGLSFLNPRTSVVRRTCYAIVDDKRFDALIMFCIAASSVLMAFESPKAMEDAAFASALEAADWCFTVLFTLEMLMKLTAFGVWLEERDGTYLRDAWNVMDGAIVLVGILGKALSGTNISWVRALRTMRVLRPLRVISRVPELRVVVDALLRSLPGLGNVLLVALLFWLIFGILGMQLFMGAFSRCSDESVATKALCVDGWVNATLDVAWDSVSQTCAGWAEMVASTQELTDDALTDDAPTSDATCVGSYASSVFVERTWDSGASNFDSIFDAMLTLFEMSTTEGWTAVMYDGVDARSPELAPRRDHNPAVAFFFVIFMILANFFILNLFVGIILDNFARIAEERGDGSSATMTKEQQLWSQRKRNFFDVGEDYGQEDAVMLGDVTDDDDDEKGKTSSGKELASSSESASISALNRPMSNQSPPASPRARRARRGFRRARRFLFRASHSTAFEAGVMAVIVLNAGAMACEHYGQTQAWTDTLSGISYACTAVFIVEAIIKLVAMGRKYFNSRWNAFDFFCVATSVVGLAADVGSTTSVLRVFRLARVFRLVRKLKGLRMLFNTLVISLPGLVNIGALLFLLCFVFAVLGMNLFGKVTFGENLNEDANFTNFGNSLLILLRMVTGEAWNSIMYDTMVTEKSSDCDPGRDCAPGTCCGVAGAPAYFVAFVVLGSFVTLNLLIAVVVDNFSNNAKDVEGEDVREADVRAFERGWCRIDKRRTGYIPRADLPDLIRKVPPPLGARGQKTTRLSSTRFQKNLDITEYAPSESSEWVHFEDALMSFTRHAMGIRTNTLPEDTREEVRAELAKRAAASFARVREGRSFEEAGPPSAAASKKKNDAGESESESESDAESAATTPAGSPREFRSSASFGRA